MGLCGGGLEAGGGSPAGGGEKKEDRLENEPLSLEESYKVFSEGMELVKQGNSTIDRVEKELKVLMDGE